MTLYTNYKRQFRLVFLIIGILTSLFFSNPRKANATLFVKDPNNPIFTSEGGSWEINNVANPFILYHQGIFKMWYTGTEYISGRLIWAIGYATSSNGKDSWTRTSTPVMSYFPLEGWDEKEVSHPSIVYTTEKGYEMWFVATSERWAGGRDRFRVKYATSQDGINWTLHPKYVLKEDEYEWDNGGMGRGLSVILTPKGYEMWYGGIDEGNSNWRIGYANSSNGIDWVKYPTPAVTPEKPWELSWLSYPEVFYDGSTYHIFYIAASRSTGEHAVYAYSKDGIQWVKPNTSINPVFTIDPSPSFDSDSIVTPSFIKEGNLFKIWYGGFNNSRWAIGYAEGTLPEPTPLLQPLILLPGLGGSWNHEEIFLGIDQPQSSWYKTPFRTDYDGLIQTLQNAGYTLGENLFVFYYDWLQPINKSADDLKNYIDMVVNPPPGTKVDLLGHSLGGLVARTYIQNNPGNHKVNSLITAGSPHKGAPQVYKAWEGADLTGLLGEKERIGAGIILRLRGFGYQNLVSTIQNLVPSLGNLLFIDDYLKWNEGGAIKLEASMSQRNIWLHGLGVSSELLGLANTLVGTAGDTPRWLKIIERNQIDQLLGRWQDGKPVDEEYALGDKTVLEESAKLLGANIIALADLDHGDLVKSIPGQEKILELLGLSSIEIVEQPEIPFEPALVFTVASPVNLRVTDPLERQIGAGIDPPQIPNATFSVSEKIIIIPQAVDGEYKVEIISEGDSGLYQLLIGQLTESQDIWSKYENKISKGETDTFTIPIDQTLTTTDSYLANLINLKLKNLLREIRYQEIDPIVKVKLTAKIWSILGQTESLSTLLSLGRDKMAVKYVQKAIFKTTEAIDYAEKFNPTSLPSLREILDLLDQLHQLL